MHLKDYREREGGGQHGEIESAKLLERFFHLLNDILNVCNDLGWARQRPGV